MFFVGFSQIIKVRQISKNNIPNASTIPKLLLETTNNVWDPNLPSEIVYTSSLYSEYKKTLTLNIKTTS